MSAPLDPTRIEARIALALARAQRAISSTALVPFSSFGGVADGIIIPNASIAAGSNVVTLPGRTIGLRDVGKSLSVTDAGDGFSGPGTGPLLATITAPGPAPDQAILSAPATFTRLSTISAWGTDNAPALNAMSAALSGSSKSIWFDEPGVSVLASPWHLTSLALQAVGGPGVTLCANIAASLDGGSGSIFSGSVPATDPSYSQLLTAPAVIGTRTLAVDTTGLAIGDRVQVITAGGGFQFTAYYIVTGIAPGVLTVERPIWAPFDVVGLNATTVNRILVPQTQFQLDGQWMSVTGSGNRYTEIFGGLDCQIQRVRFEESGGHLIGGAFACSYDEGSRRCFYTHCTADIPNGAGACFDAEGLGEDNGILYCSGLSNPVPGSVGAAAYDQYNMLIVGFRATNTAVGVYVGTNGSAQSISCVVEGGAASGCSQNGLLVDAAWGTSVIGFAAEACGGNGIVLDNNPNSGKGPISTTLLGCKARWNAHYGVDLRHGAGTRYKDLDVSFNAVAGLVSASDVAGEGLYSAAGSSTGASAVLVATGGVQSHKDEDITLTGQAPQVQDAAVFVQGADATISGRVTYSAAGAPAPKACVTVAGGSAVLEDFTAAGGPAPVSALSYGAKVEAGASLSFGANVSLPSAVTRTPFVAVAGAALDGSVPTLNDQATTAPLDSPTFQVLLQTVNAGTASVDTTWQLEAGRAADVAGGFNVTDRANDRVTSGNLIANLRNYGGAFAVAGQFVGGTTHGDAALNTCTMSLAVVGGTLIVTVTPPAGYNGTLEWVVTLPVGPIN